MPVRSLNEPAALPGPLACTGVPPDGPRDAAGRGVGPKVALGAVPPLGVFGRLPSFLTAGLSLRIDSCEGALGRPDWPWPEAVLPMAVADSEPGAGDWTAALLAAAGAIRKVART